jgi:Tfp pilus assembly protein PilX
MIDKIRNQAREQGMILVALTLLMTAFTVIGLALFSYTSSQYSRTRNNVFVANAMQVAEAGIEQSLYEINQNEAFTGYVSEQTFLDNATQGKAVYTTEVSPTPDSNAKTVTSTGKIYRQSDTSNPVSTRKIKVTIVGTNSEGYSVHTGPGGLILSGSANITNSDVFVNGRITMSGSAKIGTTSQPVDVNVANIACPNTANPGPTFPQLCTDATQPISLQQSTFIYGTVCATGQTSAGPRPGGNILPGSGGEGLKPGCVAPPVSAPTYDRTAHINAVNTTGAGNSNTYVCNNWPFARTWPANLKLTGNVNVAGSCEVKIMGDVYITGDLDLGGAAKITVDESVGTDRPVVMVDGKITIGGSARVIANSAGTGVHFVSFKSSAACSPDCATVTGTDLKNSQNLETVTVGGGVNMPGMIFHAHWGKVRLGGSGNVGAAAGQTVDLSGAGTVTFGTILSSGNRTWTVTSYQQIFD